MKTVTRDNKRLELKKRLYHEDVIVAEYISSKPNGAEWTREATREKMEQELGY